VDILQDNIFDISVIQQSRVGGNVSEDLLQQLQPAFLASLV